MSDHDQQMFARYAVRTGAVTQAQADEAVAAWERDPSRSVEEILVASGALAPEKLPPLHLALAMLGGVAGRTTEEGGVALEGQTEDGQRTRIDRTPRPPVDERETAPRTEIPPDEEGVPFEHAGRYSLKAVSGRGGQARVMLAVDAFMGREVALKILEDEETTDPDGSRASSRLSVPGSVRFLREARVTGQLEHPNIVPVYEVGRRQDGSLYYTMRLVKGTTLARAIDGCAGLAERLKLLGACWDVCKAIAFAHSRGVVHRDIKSENVMVGEFGETVLLDWGVAKVKGLEDIRAREIEKDLKLLQLDGNATMAGLAVGTPSYMSPEQAMGRVDDIDDRSDVWGLGALLYELLTGRPPFEGETSRDILIHVVKEALTPVCRLCPDAPAELAAIAEKALKKKKEDRYQSAKEVADEIGAFMTGGRVRAYEYSSWELVRRFAQKNRAAVAAAALALVVILGALVAVTVALRNETRARENERQAREREEVARHQEHEERLAAGFHLAEAFVEKADRLMDDRRFAPATIFAASSLFRNPAHLRSPAYSPAFVAATPKSRELRVEAASQVYRAALSPAAVLERSLSGPDAFQRVAWSKAGDLLAAVSADRAVRVWDAATGALRLTLPGHTEPPEAVAFSPDGAFLASAGRDRIVILWDAKSGERKRTFAGHEAVVHDLAFSPDGGRLLTASADGTARIWDVADGRELLQISGGGGKVYTAAWSPDGRRIAVVEKERAVWIWDVARRTRLAGCEGHADRVTGVAWSPDGRSLATASYDMTVRLWDAEKCRPRAVLTGHRGALSSISYSADGALLASSGYDQTVWIWDAVRGKAVLNLQGHDEYVPGVAFAPAGHRLATAGYDRRVRVWDVREKSRVATLQGHTGLIYSLAYSADGTRLASAGLDRTAFVWDLATREPVASAVGKVLGTAVAFSPDGELLVAATRDNAVVVLDARTGAPVRSLRGHMDAVHGVAISRDGALVATASLDKKVRLWSLRTGDLVRTIAGHEGGVSQAAFSPDGKVLATASHDRTVRLWEVETGRELRVLKGHTDWVSGVAFSADGKLLASSGKDAVAILWNPSTGLELQRLVGHEQWVNQVALSPDGKLAATASDDATARVWSTADGQMLLILRSGRGIVAAEFAPDGKTLAVAEASEIKLYPLDFTALDVDPAKLLADAERASGLKLDGFRLRADDR